jgi:sialic acid synthase SpsE
MKWFMNKFTINRRTIGNSEPAYFIADIAANHDGSLERAQELIYMAKEAGADAAKFQHFRAETIVSNESFKLMGSQKSHQSKWEKSVFQVYQDASVPVDWTHELKETCDSVGIDFFTSPYDIPLVDEIDPYVPAYKIGSGDITWKEMLKKIASKGKPTMIATGASALDDVVKALEVLSQYDVPLLLMQCNTNYTASLENFKHVNLHVLKLYAQMYPGIPLGLSDHTPGHVTVLGAVALGACAIEKHFTDDCTRTGPDHTFSMDPNSWREMVDRTRELEAALGDGKKRIEANESDTVVLQRRSLHASRALFKGDLLDAACFIALRPALADSIPPYEVENLIGKRLLRDVAKGQMLKLSDFR